jgi:hypothetical protein
MRQLVGGRTLWQRIGGMPARELRGHAIGAQDGVGRRIFLEPFDSRCITSLRRRDHVGAFLTALDRTEFLEVGARGVVELDLELVRFDLVERMRQLVDRVVLCGARRVPTLVVRGQREILINLFRRQHRNVAVHAARLVAARRRLR